MKLVFENNEICRELYGIRESNLKILEEALSISLSARGNELMMKGSEDRLDIAKSLLEQMVRMVRQGFSISVDDVRRNVKNALDEKGIPLGEVLTDTILFTHRNRRITPKGSNQKLYVDAIRRHDLVFGIGPAGTGKTYLAMAMAVDALQRKAVERIILTRPAVEAGERLGFLPGSLQEKISPYLRPLYDALQDMIEMERAEMLLAKGIVEVAPLAFMRGRTLNNAFIILDEAQNTTHEQMKMFLTRLGYDSKAIVTGDITQNDLPRGVRSGLDVCQDILKGVEGIQFCYFDDSDVVRHPLVQRIIRAYARDEKRKQYDQKEQRSESTEDTTTQATDPSLLVME